jgi:Domain of unknown function (DUF4375)
LLEVGATQTPELLRRAKDIVFPTTPVPAETETRRDQVPVADPDDPAPEWLQELDELDQRFYADADGLTPRLEAFARQHGLVSAPEDADR